MIEIKKYKKLEENSALQYLKNFKNLFKNVDIEGNELWNWRADISIPVKCTSYKNIPSLEEKVENFLKRNRIVKKECYYNSMKVVWGIPNTEYVEGIANLIIPIDHAWNYYKGFYFDLTAEILLGIDVEKRDYAQTVKLDRKLMDKYASKTGLSGNYVIEYYLDKIEKR